ncbi:MAG: SP_1767 family glycosyltransferase [Clostridia bacterium]|nr:SP_1767 family glycosyltransferase [Clostridia bacterium]
MKSFLLKIWNGLYDLKVKFIDLFWLVFDFFYSRVTKKPAVASVEETIDTIVKNNCSIARFGDGEIKLVAGRDISFQKATPFAVSKLREVLSSDVDGMLVGIADIFGDRSRYNEKANDYWKKHLHRFRKVWYRYLIKGKKYYNASMTRQYIALNDRSQGEGIYNSMKKIWEGKDVVFIEGEKSRMGVGNDLFSGAKSINRIIGPSTQAFSRYDEILEEALKQKKDVLFLIALGPAATGLAYDLHLNGYQAVDIGHVDVEYEWLLMGAEKKTALKNKMVFEAAKNSAVEDCFDEKYESEIIAKFI